MNVPITTLGASTADSAVTWFTLPWAELGAPAVLHVPSGGKRWRSAPDGRSDSTREELLEPAIRQEELPTVDPAVLAELVEQHDPDVPVTSGPDLPAAVEVGTAAASASTAGEAGTAAAGTAGAAGGEDECCCRKQRE